jgi:hypothetical protein
MVDSAPDTARYCSAEIDYRTGDLAGSVDAPPPERKNRHGRRVTPITRVSTSFDGATPFVSKGIHGRFSPPNHKPNR